jgi:hypothetical protein
LLIVPSWAPWSTDSTIYKCTEFYRQGF